MKKYLIGAASAGAMALAFSMSATPAYALNVSDYCTANADFGTSHGDCVSGIQKSVPQLCKAFLDADPVAFEAAFGSTALGACVSAVRHAIKDL